MHKLTHSVFVYAAFTTLDERLSDIETQKTNRYNNAKSSLISWTLHFYNFTSSVFNDRNSLPWFIGNCRHIVCKFIQMETGWILEWESTKPTLSTHYSSSSSSRFAYLFRLQMSRKYTILNILWTLSNMIINQYNIDRHLIISCNITVYIAVRSFYHLNRENV